MSVSCSGIKGVSFLDRTSSFSLAWWIDGWVAFFDSFLVLDREGSVFWKNFFFFGIWLLGWWKKVMKWEFGV
jgi:hypothetical protein